MNTNLKRGVVGVFAALAITTSSLLAEGKTYAVVNGDAITDTDIALILRNPNIKFDTLPKATQDRVIKQLIDNKLLRQHAVNSGIEKDKKYQETLDNLKKDLALQVWMQNFSKEIKISEKDQKEFFEKNKEKFKSNEELKARHILVKTETEAKSLIDTLSKSKDVEAKFIELAKSKSVGPSGKNGGDLGWFPLNQMVPEFSQAAAALKVKSFTKEPVKTQFGYHVIFLEDRKGAKEVSFESVKAQIKQMMMQERFSSELQSLASKLKKDAKIEYK